MFIGGVSGMEGKVWSGEGEGFGGEPVDKIGGGMKCLYPVDRGKTHLK
jgi:hypothetical protein